MITIFLIIMDFDFLNEGLIEPNPVGRARTNKTPKESIWERYIKLSRNTIANSIEQWEIYIDRPEKRAEKYYAAKNWNIVNKEQFLRGNPAEVSCSMTVGRNIKLKVIPKYLWEGRDENRKLLVDYSRRVGAVIQREENVMPTLKNFQQILSILDKDSEEGQIFWKQAIAIAKPKSKKNWVYDETKDLWLESNKTKF